MVRATYTVRQKLQIVIEATEDKAAVKGTARRHGVLPGQVRRWIKDRDELETAVQVNPRVRSLNKGCPRINAALEEELAAWIIDRRKQELAVTTNQNTIIKTFKSIGYGVPDNAVKPPTASAVERTAVTGATADPVVATEPETDLEGDEEVVLEEDEALHITL
ncbi:hypothetical protein PR003_g10993 [Phytophthora rubi]|uniref:HTH psq-type domain-containing protein n=1 Tax=Phytophthora rubi TaxID=129364 RepID=A0A6A4FC68_9STRA|nr:hypothetical protein PR003_g10993 [Phytophthora rubi]